MNNPVQKEENSRSILTLLRDVATSGLMIIYALLNIYEQTGEIQLISVPFMTGIIIGFVVFYIINFLKIGKRIQRETENTDLIRVGVIMVGGAVIFGSILVLFSVSSIQAFNWLIGFSLSILVSILFTHIILNYS